MATIKTGTIQYFDESSYSVRDAGIDIYRRFGLETGDMPLPVEKPMVVFQTTAAKFVPNKLDYGNITVEFPLTYVLLDAKELSYIGGTPAKVTTGGTPAYRHYIVPLKPSVGVSLPSRTVHIELSTNAGTTITERLDVAGCQTKDLEISYNVMDPRGVMVKETFNGQRIVTDAATHNLLGATTGAVADPETVQGQYSTNRLDETNVGSKPPIIGTNSITSVFRDADEYDEAQETFCDLKEVAVGGTAELDTGETTTFGNNTGGTTLTTLLKQFVIKVQHTLRQEYVNRSGTNNYNASIRRYPLGSFVLKTDILVSLVLDPETATLGLFETPSLLTSSNELYLKVSKRGNANDWIAFIFKPLESTGDSTENLQVDYEGIFGFKVIEGLYTVHFHAKDLVIVAGNAFATLRDV